MKYIVRGHYHRNKWIPTFVGMTSYGIKLSQYITIFFLLLILLAEAKDIFAQDNAEPLQEVKRFSLVEYQDGSSREWELRGKQAEINEGFVKIDHVSALAFGEDSAFKLKAKEGNYNKEGQLVHLEDNVVIRTTDGATLLTDSLDWDTETKEVFTDESLNIKKSGFEVVGKGAVFDLEKKSAKLEKDIKASIVEPSETVITCDGPLDIDYKKDKAVFCNNVKVEDDKGKIFSDRIDVYFRRGTGRIRCVVARGNVQIINGDNVTYSEKAIYLVDHARMILPKRPKVIIKNELSKQ